MRLFQGRMLGIAGIIAPEKSLREKGESELGGMLASMKKDAECSTGIYLNEVLGAYVGWTFQGAALADYVPFKNEKRTAMLFFCGEDARNDEEVRRLKSKGHELEKFSASYLIHLYEEAGEDFYRTLNGWFAGVLVDEKIKRVTLFNDRYGGQKVYFHEYDDIFYFSTQAKALLHVIPHIRSLDEQSLADFLAWGCVLGERALFADLKILPHGAAWEFAGGRCVRRGHYWCEQDWLSLATSEKRATEEEILSRVGEVVPRYFAGGQKVGVSLTGGLDTRLLMAAASASPGELPCYTFAGPRADTLDVRIAKKVARAAGQRHFVIRLEEDFFQEFRYLAERTIWLTDGWCDVCGCHELYLNRKARGIASIRVTGNYGGELLRGVSTYKPAPPDLTLLDPALAILVRRSLDEQKEAEAGTAMFAVLTEIPRYLHGTLLAAQSQLTVRSPYMDNDLTGLVLASWSQPPVSRKATLKAIARWNPQLAEIRTDMGLRHGEAGVWNRMLQTSLSALFKWEWYYNEGLPGWLSRTEKALTEVFHWRPRLEIHKYLHYRSWFSRELSGYVKEILLDHRSRARTHVNGRVLEKMVQDHVAGRANRTNDINKLLTVELILRQFVDQ